jgi:hypothetical protein
VRVCVVCAAAVPLDQQFRTAFGLTYRTFGSLASSIDTAKLRIGIWCVRHTTKGR